MDRPYVVSGGLWKDWDRSHKDPGNEYRSPAADTGIDLGHAMIRNPDMKVLVQQGYYDLATPYRASEYFIDAVRRELALEPMEMCRKMMEKMQAGSDPMSECREMMGSMQGNCCCPGA